MLGLLCCMIMLDICHGHHGRCPWRKNLPCGEISPHDIFSLGEILHMTDWHVERFSTWQIVMWKKLSTWEMWRKSVMWRNNVYNLWCFVALNCCKISFFGDLRCFVDNFLSQFTRFCVEKNWAKKMCPWRKMDKYHVWLYSGDYLIFSSPYLPQKIRWTSKDEFQLSFFLHSVVQCQLLS